MLLLPRPDHHVPATQLVVAKRGLANVVVPFVLSTLTPLAATLPPTVTHVVLTSASALHAWCIIPPHIPVACVGARTAEAARAIGLMVTHVGQQSAVELAAELITTLPPNQHIVHLHGDQASLDWHNTLRDAGHQITANCAYRTHYVNALPPEVFALLRAQKVSHIGLLSAGHAHHLQDLLKRANITPWPNPNDAPTVLALSPQVAQACSLFPRTMISSSPTLSSLLDLYQSQTEAGVKPLPSC